MQTIDLNLHDTIRNRQIPTCVYLPENAASKIPVVIFGPGYNGQKHLTKPTSEWGYKNHTYLANYFTNKGYAFITVQHDILGDTDGLETIDSNAPQYIVRKHLFVRGEQNLLFVIDELKKQFSQLNLEKFIVGGHSNGGDIAKYFANNYPEKIDNVIVFDGRRARIEPGKNLRFLMFEASDDTTDQGVIPGEGTQDNPQRTNLEWVIIKPKNAVHMSYTDPNMNDQLKTTIYKALDWFLGF